MSDPPINLYLQKGKVLVWNAEDVDKIRCRHRITGTQVGCFPRCSFQNVFLGLPVQLALEEAHLLISKGLAVLVKNTKLNKTPTDDERAHVDKYAETIYQHQVQLIMAQRRAEIELYAESIVAGRTKMHGSRRAKRKAGTAIDSEKGEEGDGGSSAEQVQPTQAQDVEAQKEAIIADVMKKRVSVPSRDLTLTPVLYECPRTKASDLVPTELDYPTSEVHTVRCRVYQDLWEKGHYMTVGSKFGGDFLVYSGDPLLFHAYGIVVCLGKDTHISGRDLIMWGRLGNSVHKTIILAMLQEDDKVHYLSLRWSGEL